MVDQVFQNPNQEKQSNVDMLKSTLNTELQQQWTAEFVLN